MVKGYPYRGQQHGNADSLLSARHPGSSAVYNRIPKESMRPEALGKRGAERLGGVECSVPDL